MTINIPLDKEHFITSDANNIIVAKDKRFLSFHTSISEAVLSFIAMRVRGCDAKSMDELISFEKSLVTAINKSQHTFKIEMREAK